MAFKKQALGKWDSGIYLAGHPGKKLSLCWCVGWQP